MNLRYKISPQMQEYDQLGIAWSPYTMFHSTPSYRSSIVNTDRFGLRNTIADGKSFSLESLEGCTSCSIVVGGSTVFGVGSSSDLSTIPSILSNSTKSFFLNFGGRAYNSTQELILFCRFASLLPKLDNVLIFSGLNNLYLSKYEETIFPPYFFSHLHNESMLDKRLSAKRKFLKLILNPIFGSNINYETDSVKDLIKIFNNYRVSQSFKLLCEDKFNLTKAVKTFEEDLYIWKNLSSSMNFNLQFILQPIPSWCQKIFSTEEVQLFEFLDQQLISFDALRLLSTQELYYEYCSSLRKVCNDLGINFTDANLFFKSTDEWLFVDRAHLTDRGNVLMAKMLTNVLK